MVTGLAGPVHQCSCPPSPFDHRKNEGNPPKSSGLFIVSYWNAMVNHMKSPWKGHRLFSHHSPLYLLEMIKKNLSVVMFNSDNCQTLKIWWYHQCWTITNYITITNMMLIDFEPFPYGAQIRGSLRSLARLPEIAISAPFQGVEIVGPQRGTVGQPPVSSSISGQSLVGSFPNQFRQW